MAFSGVAADLGSRDVVCDQFGDLSGTADAQCPHATEPLTGEPPTPILESLFLAEITSRGVSAQCLRHVRSRRECTRRDTTADGHHLP